MLDGSSVSVVSPGFVGSSGFDGSSTSVGSSGFVGFSGSVGCSGSATVTVTVGFANVSSNFEPFAVNSVPEIVNSALSTFSNASNCSDIVFAVLLVSKADTIKTPSTAFLSTKPKFTDIESSINLKLDWS